MLKTVKEILRNAEEKLVEAGICDSPNLDVKYLLAHVMGVEPSEILMIGNKPVPFDKEDDFEELLKRRMKYEPVAKIIGRRGFWKHDFKVNQYVLDPRSDTETLVETALKHAASMQVKKIADFGVGSGCILLSVLSELEDVCGIGVDISEEAIKVAEENADICDVKEKVGFLRKSWRDADFLDFIERNYDIIISNPPYITTSDYNSLSKEVLYYDPEYALCGGEDGLDAYRELAPIFAKILSNDGVVVLEIGKGQMGDVVKIMSAHGFVLIDKVRDLGGVVRCLVLKK